MVTTVIKVRKVLEKLYDGAMDVIEYQKVTKENKTTGFEEVKVLEAQPCRLSFSSFPAANETDVSAKITQSVKVFLAPEIEVKPGSKLTVTQNGITTAYKSSGVPAVYASHQEVQLELFDGWS